MSKEADIFEIEGAVQDYMRQVENGEQITILKNGIPLATVQPLPQLPLDQRKVGTNKGSINNLGDITGPCLSFDPPEHADLKGIDLSNVKIHGSLEGPCIPLEDWNMLKD